MCLYFRFHTHPVIHIMCTHVHSHIVLNVTREMESFGPALCGTKDTKTDHEHEHEHENDYEHSHIHSLVHKLRHAAKLQLAGECDGAPTKYLNLIIVNDYLRWNNLGAVRIKYACTCTLHCKKILVYNDTCSVHAECREQHGDNFWIFGSDLQRRCAMRK
jgi:hypothetical protein